MSDEQLPNGWAQTEIAEILVPQITGKPFQQGWSPRCHSQPAADDEWGVLKTTAIQQSEFWPHENKALPAELEPRPGIEVRAGDILMTCAGPRNRCGVACYVKAVPPKLMMSGKMYRFRPDERVVDPIYLMHFLTWHESQMIIDRMKTGISDSGLNLTHGRFAIFPLTVPPLAEQKRIVAKVEELFAKLDKGIESLRDAQTQLKLYRQSLLKHAFEGKLTADWRAANADKLETPDQILARIKSERAARHAEQMAVWKTAVAAWKKGGEVGKKPTKPRKLKTAVAIEEGELPEIPASWCWVSLDQLVSGKTRAMQSGPFGSNLKHSEFRPQGILVLGIDNVKEGQFSIGSQNRISELKYRELEKYTARPRDLLVTVMASLGRSCVVPKGLETAIITKHVYRISMETDQVSPEFYNQVLQAHWVTRQRMFKNAQGQTRPGLNSEILRSLPMPLCDLREQNEILQILDSRLSDSKVLETEIETQLAKSEALRQSILKHAFSGKLVPQAPDDEHASVLLERIRAERAADKPPKRQPRKRKAKAKA